MIRRCSAVAAGGTGAAVLMHLLAAVIDPGPLSGVMQLRELPLQLYLAAAAAGGAAAWIWNRKDRVRSEYVLRPLLLLVFIFFPLWSQNSGILPVVLLISGWSVFRMGAVGILPESLSDIKEKNGWYIAAALGTVTLLWSFLVQKAAFDSWFLIFGDWGQYAECYLRLAFGESGIKEWLCSAGHFNPLPNVIMTAAVFLAPAPETIFFMNAVFIASAVPLSFVLARKNDLPVKYAAATALLAALNPVFTRQSLSLFYGFHPIVIFIPLFLGFFICRSLGKKWGMVLCAVLSLLVQETVAVFWFGWGFYLFLRKKYWNGTALMAGMTLWFALLSMAVQPWAAGAAVYAQNFRYAALGNTPLEVALSPFMRPGAVLEALASERNFTYLAILLAPLGAAVWAFPALLAAALPLLTGIFLQSADTIKTPLLQYGVELAVLFWSISIAALGRLYRGERSGTFPKRRWYRHFRGAWAALIFCGAGGYVFFGSGFKCGLYPGEIWYHRPDAGKAINFLRRHLPEDLPRLLAPNRLRAHFMFDCPTAPLTDKYREGDWLLLDLHDPAFETPGSVEHLRYLLAHDKRVRGVTQVNWYGKQLVLFHVGSADAPHRIRAAKITAEHFRRAAGGGLPSPLEGISVRCDGRQLHFRIDRKLKADYDVFIFLKRPDGRVQKYEYTWYFGFFPAWSQEPGTLWSLPLPGRFSGIEVKFREREASGMIKVPEQS